MYTYVSAYLHVIQYVIYTCLLYGHGLNWYIDSIFSVITVLKDMFIYMYIMPYMLHPSSCKTEVKLRGALGIVVGLLQVVMSVIL